MSRRTVNFASIKTWRLYPPIINHFFLIFLDPIHSKTPNCYKLNDFYFFLLFIDKTSLKREHKCCWKLKYEKYLVLIFLLNFGNYNLISKFQISKFQFFLKSENWNSETCLTLFLWWLVWLIYDEKKCISKENKSCLQNLLFNTDFIFLIVL